MRIALHINYVTAPDETICICGNTPECGSFDEENAAVMNLGEGGEWSLVFDLAPPLDMLEYHYLLKSPRGVVVRREWGNRRSLWLNPSLRRYHIRDHWQELPAGFPFHSSAFTDVFFRRPESQAPLSSRSFNLTIQVWAPYVQPGQRLVLCGEGDALGDWNPREGVLMDDGCFPLWSARIDTTPLPSFIRFKFVVVGPHRETIYWEEGEDRCLDLMLNRSNEAVVLSGLHFRRSTYSWKTAGVAIPLFSLRSDQSAGIGDLGDLPLLADWAKQTGLRIVQLLPVNDTTMTRTWTDSYPYNANSIYALHPLYLRMERMGRLADAGHQESIDQRARELNALPEVDYEAVEALKWEFFQAFYLQEGAATLASAQFQAFLATEREWLMPYALFCMLRDLHHTPDFSLWGDAAVYSPTLLEGYFRPASDSYRAVGLHLFLQYHLHLQLTEAKEYARRQGVVFKGDIPIGISRHSVEAWVEPNLFHLQSQAGAPPDEFSVTGQNWGFPTYHWDAMAKDGLAWWRKRFCKMADYFDAYRIDHILGFFRIWEIPLHSVQGLLGHFSPALPLSRQEISAWGVEWTDAYLVPYIRRWFLTDLFGEHTAEAIETFLIRGDYGVYRLRPEFDTQRKVQAFFEGRTDALSLCFRNGLYALLNEVLFVEDTHTPGRFHPRIAARNSYVYRSLSEADQKRFEALYNDFFYARHNHFWKEKAYEKLPLLIGATSMLACAEDLGMIPGCVPEVMHALQILSLEIERMPKGEGTWGMVSGYPYLSVATTSTHDMSPLRLWWRENHELTQRYYHEVLGRDGVAPADCTPDLCEQIVYRHLQSPSMLVILPWQDWLSIDPLLRRDYAEAERINIPANPRHYWRYRMHLTLEQLNRESRLNHRIRGLIEHTGR